MDGVARPTTKMIAPLGWIAVWGPGLLVMLADTDVGNVVTGAQAGAQWGYRLLPLLLLLIPMLYMVQELTVRLGLSTGRGHGELIRERFGVGWAWLSTAGLAAAVIGSLITEFTGVAGIGELYGLPRALTLPLAAAALLAVVATGSYRRVERTAIVIGLFELAFFAVAWAAHPSLAALARDALDLPLGNSDFMFLVAAVIGATFNPWMIFYQQSAIADKKLRPDDLAAARWDTAFGAVLTQCLTGAVLVAAAATLYAGSGSAGLGSVGEISNALTPLLGESVGRLRLQRGRPRRLAGGRHRVLAGAGLGRGRGRRLSAFAGKSPLRGEMVLWRLCGLGRRLRRRRLARPGPRLAHDRSAGSERFPAAAGDRLPRGAGGDGAAGRPSSARALSLGLDRRLGRRHRRGSLWRRRGTDLAPGRGRFL